MRVQFLQEWSTALKEFVGLPRPFAKYKKGIGPHNLPSKTPIPWQSIPDTKAGNLRLFQKHEDSVYKDRVCAYCGIVFESNEEAIRWTTVDKPLTKSGQRVFSDVHPFHFECMKQARIYCPHMKTTADEEFEIGTYAQLRANADLQIASYLLP
jgi:hypothetical protein